MEVSISLTRSSKQQQIYRYDVESKSGKKRLCRLSANYKEQVHLIVTSVGVIGGHDGASIIVFIGINNDNVDDYKSYISL